MVIESSFASDIAENNKFTGCDIYKQLMKGKVNLRPVQPISIDS